MLDIRGATYTVRQGRSYARGTTIDEYLSPEDCDLLYSQWKEDWPEPLQFHGNVKAITCEMVLEVPEKDFKAVYKNRCDAILEVARRNTG